MDYIVTASVAVLDTSTAISLFLVNQKGIAVGSQRELVSGKGAEAMIAAIEKLVPSLMSQARSGQGAPAQAGMGSRPSGLRWAVSSRAGRCPPRTPPAPTCWRELGPRR